MRRDELIPEIIHAQRHAVEIGLLDQRDLARQNDAPVRNTEAGELSCSPPSAHRPRALLEIVDPSSKARVVRTYVQNLSQP